MMTEPAALPTAVDPPFAPLAGVRIVDFSTNMAGPYATMILAQLGADVVKVEQPTGDDARYWPPEVDGGSVVHRCVNAGKRGVVLDLTSAEGREAALALCARSDVLLQSMRPGVAERIGIGEEAVRAVNPEILYYALNAFGAGPVGRGLPGYDPLVQAFSGIMRMNGHEGAPPVRCAPSVIDLGTGNWVAMGVLACMLARERGQPVRSMETALVDTAFSLVGYQATNALMTGQRPKRAGSGNPIAAPYEVYAARDGELMIAAPNQRLWERVAHVIGAPELIKYDRFRTVTDRSRNNGELSSEIVARLAGETVDVWIERFRAAGVPVTRVAGLEEAVQTQTVAERRIFANLDGVPQVRLPWVVDGATVPWARPAPKLGEHTAEVLLELGFVEGSTEREGAPHAVPDQ
jgi:formyl-CoA transferase